jgi:putative photosynthetic complex assembly protein
MPTAMNPTRSPDAIPRSLILGMGAMVVVTLLSVGAFRLSGSSTHTADAAPIAQRSLRFEDGADGSVLILDGRTGRELDRVQGEAGFLRGALRVMSRERRMRDLGSAPAFDLIARADGRLTLMDAATGERIDLEAFGPTNAMTFARLLTVSPDPASTLSRSTQP